MSKKQSVNSTLLTVGWREWVALPDLGIPAIKSKIDTGAKTSALHAFNIERYKKQSTEYLRFHLHPLQNNNDLTIVCHSPLLDQRYVTDSGGHKELRYVIQTTLVLNQNQWLIEMTLTNRDTMRFKMLLGRTAMHGRLIVDPNASFLTRKCKAIDYYQ